MRLSPGSCRRIDWRAQRWCVSPYEFALLLLFVPPSTASTGAQSPVSALSHAGSEEVTHWLLRWLTVRDFPSHFNNTTVTSSPREWDQHRSVGDVQTCNHYQPRASSRRFVDLADRKILLPIRGIAAFQFDFGPSIDPRDRRDLKVGLAGLAVVGVIDNDVSVLLLQQRFAPGTEPAAIAEQ
jgi:hypothetical protein